MDGAGTELTGSLNVCRMCCSVGTGDKEKRNWSLLFIEDHPLFQCVVVLPELTMHCHPRDDIGQAQYLSEAKAPG